MQGKSKDYDHTTHVIIQLNACDSLLESGSHEVDIKSALITVKIGIAQKDKVVLHRSKVLHI